MSQIPQQIVDYNVYVGSTASSNKLLGTGEEITLPSIVTKTFSALLAAGDFEAPTLMTENMEFEIPFNVIDSEGTQLVSVSKVTKLILRGAAQHINTSDHDFDYKQVKLEIKGFCKEVNLGKLKRGDKMDSSIKMNLSYIKFTLDNKVMLEIDKFTGTFIMDGKDVRKPIEKYI